MSRGTARSQGPVFTKEFNNEKSIALVMLSVRKSSAFMNEGSVSVSTFSLKINRFSYFGEGLRREDFAF